MEWGRSTTRFTGKGSSINDVGNWDGVKKFVKIADMGEGVVKNTLYQRDLHDQLWNGDVLPPDLQVRGRQ